MYKDLEAFTLIGKATKKNWGFIIISTIFFIFYISKTSEAEDGYVMCAVIWDWVEQKEIDELGLHLAVSAAWSY